MLFLHEKTHFKIGMVSRLNNLLGYLHVYTIWGDNLLTSPCIGIPLSFFSVFSKFDIAFISVFIKFEKFT